MASPFRAIAYSVSSQWKENRKLSNILNWFVRHWNGSEGIKEAKIKPSIMQDQKSKSREENAELRIYNMAILRMVDYLLGNSFKVMIELWNPKDKRKRRILGKKQLEAIEKGEKNGYKKGGLTPYALSVIAIGIGKKYTEKHGTGWTVPNEGIEEFHNEIFDLAEEYHTEKEAERLARAKKKASKETAESNPKEQEPKTDKEQVFTVENYLSGDLNASEIIDVDLAKEFHADDRVKGAKKGALTRQIKKLEAV